MILFYSGGAGGDRIYDCFPEAQHSLSLGVMLSYYSEVELRSKGKQTGVRIHTLINRVKERKRKQRKK